MKTRKQIMTEAHKIARTLEGDYIARLSEGLRISWKNKKVEKSTSVYVDRILRITDKAIQVKFENKVASGCYTSNTTWLPKSQISGEFGEFSTHVNGEFIQLPFWLANKLVDQGIISRIDLR